MVEKKNTFFPTFSLLSADKLTIMNRGEAGNPQACASCRHQRKKCDETCELAPYFPAKRYPEFQNAHRVFGVSNIVKIMNAVVEPHQRQAAADSILMEANARRNDPVHGCLGIVRSLKSQIESYQKQLEIANHHLAFFRETQKIEQQQKLGGFKYLTTILPDHQLVRLAMIPSDFNFHCMF
jgi:hypothetical protein